MNNWERKTLKMKRLNYEENKRKKTYFSFKNSRETCTETDIVYFDGGIIKIEKNERLP